MDFQTTTGALAVQGAICGGVIGIAQAIVLQRRLGRVRDRLATSLAGLWALGWTITASAGVDVEVAIHRLRLDRSDRRHRRNGDPPDRPGR